MHKIARHGRASRGSVKGQQDLDDHGHEIRTITATRSGRARPRNLDGYGHENWTVRRKADLTARDYTSGFVKINNAKTGSSSNWNPLICHEVGHVLGLMHITTGGIVGSKATCMGGEFQGPYIDDQFLLTRIYSTPLAPS